MATPRTKYLTNAELMREIHEAKKSYCIYEGDQYQDYDIIVDSLDAVSEETFELGKKSRSTRDDTAITNEQVVIRVMCDDHIPRIVSDDPEKQDKLPTLPFPPFKHFVLVGGEFVEVARSHWKSDSGIDAGHYCIDHGDITNSLSRMIILIVKRYSTKGNWRGPHLDEMIATGVFQLYRAALKFNEAKSNNPFSFYTTIITNAFRGVLNDEKKVRRLRDDLMIAHGELPSFGRQLEESREYDLLLNNTGNFTYSGARR